MQDGHGMRRFFLRKLWRRFSTVRGHRHYGFTGRSEVWIRYVAGWTRSASAFLSAIPVRHCTCRICRISTVFLMPKLTRWTTWCSFPPSAEVKPSALLALSADLSAINASSLTVKAFIDIQDDNLPKLVVCQSLSIGPGGDHGAVRLVLPPKRRADLDGNPRSRRKSAAVQRRRRRACGGKRAIPFSSLNLPKISAATTAAAAYYPLLFCI